MYEPKRCCETCGHPSPRVAVCGECETALKAFNNGAASREAEVASRTRERDEATAMLARAEQALSLAMMLLGRTGHALADFEERGAAFDADTGMLPPGMSRPLESGEQDDLEERRARFRDWYASKVGEVRAAWKAIAHA